MKRTIRRVADYFTAASFIIAVIFAAAWFGRLGESEYGGPFRVVDGDSIEMGEIRFRLEGIDAPEYRQMCSRSGVEWPCGKQAASFLRTMMGQPGTVCVGLGIDKYERVLAKCRLNDQDINGRMVEEGWAVSFGAYYGEENRARQSGAGIWSGDFVRPQEWRDLDAATASEELPGNGLLDAAVMKMRLWWRLIFGN